MSSTANMMRRMPSVFAGAFSGSAVTAGGVWNFVSSTRPWPSGVRIMAMSARTSLSPTTRSTTPTGAGASPSSSIPSSAKNAFAASRSSTTMRTLSIRRVVISPEQKLAQVLAHALDRLGDALVGCRQRDPEEALARRPVHRARRDHHCRLLQDQLRERGRGVALRHRRPDVDRALALLHADADLTQGAHHEVPAPRVDLVHLNDPLARALERRRAGELHGLE